MWSDVLEGITKTEVAILFGLLCVALIFKQNRYNATIVFLLYFICASTGKSLFHSEYVFYVYWLFAGVMAGISAFLVTKILKRKSSGKFWELEIDHKPISQRDIMLARLLLAVLLLCTIKHADYWYLPNFHMGKWYTRGMLILNCLIIGLLFHSFNYKLIYKDMKNGASRALDFIRSRWISIFRNTK